ncbi:MAG: hypothetical protein HYU64_15345 [Armatimonadetes bacterium]|nr:hypothetical protein [Armatimonadota bacterium]
MKEVTETLQEEPFNGGKRAVISGVLAALAGAGLGYLTGNIPGMIAGAVLGGGTGAAIGLHTAQGDKVSEVWVTKAIQDPTMVGAEKRVVENGHWMYDNCGGGHGHVHDSHCHSHYMVDGYWVRFSPDIRWKNVGQYQVPTLQHSNMDGVLSGLLSTGAGAGIGTAVGFGLRALLAAA